MIGVRKIGCCYAVTVSGSNRTVFRSHSGFSSTLLVIISSLVAKRAWPSTRVDVRQAALLDLN